MTKFEGLKRTGLFIVIDGTDGCGKTSTLRRLKKLISDVDIPTIYTKEPAGTALGNYIRTLILTPDLKLDKIQQTKLFTRARVDHLNKVIIPAMKQHKLIICDRYLPSALAYQGNYGYHHKKIYEKNHILQYNNKMLDTYSSNIIPDLNIYLQGKSKRVIKRLINRNYKSDIFDQYYSNPKHLKHLQWQFRCALRELPSPYLWVDADKSSWWRAKFIFYQIKKLVVSFKSSEVIKHNYF